MKRDERQMGSPHRLVLWVGLAAIVVACGGQSGESTAQEDGGTDAGTSPADSATGSKDATKGSVEDDGSVDAWVARDDAALPDATVTADAGDAASEDSSVADAADAALIVADDGGVVADASADAEPDTSVDAGLDATLSSSDDAGLLVNADTSDGIEPDPMAYCQSATTRDVFYVNASAPGAPAFGVGAEILTNLDTNWTFESSPTYLFLGHGDVLQLGAVPLPGQYALGASSSPSFDLVVSGYECSVMSGTLDVVDYETFLSDAGTTLPSSILLSYAVQCSGYDNGPPYPMEGCVRYAPSPPVQGGDDAGAGDGGIFSACASGGNVFYVDAEGGYGALSGPMIITGAQGTWGAGGEGEFDVIVSDESIAPWEIQITATSFAPGTYTATGSMIQVEANGLACSAMPAGTYTIVTLEETDQFFATQALIGFDLTCQGQGLLRGCVSYQP